jgi:hypothetical protein
VVGCKRLSQGADFPHKHGGKCRIGSCSKSFPYPEQNAEVNTYVLKLNGTLKLKGVSFGIRNQHLILSYIRPVQGLDPGELEWIIASIAVIADEYDDFLIEKFKL